MPPLLFPPERRRRRRVGAAAAFSLWALFVGGATVLALGQEAAPAADTPDEPGAVWEPAAPTNFQRANRPASGPIDTVVIHDIEGTAEGCVRWFQNPAARVSAHYVVDAETGRVWQQVMERDIGWHAGNRDVNARSIGIEHEGYAYRPGFFTPTLYEASARLVRSITTRHNIPRDRTRIIAHAEVPSLRDPTRRGGSSGHTDPGPYWDWDYYMALVRNDARLESQTFPLRLRPGEKAEATVTLTNTGDDAWPSHRTGRQNLQVQARGPVYLGAVGAEDYASPFFGIREWVSPRIAAAPAQDGDAAPGAPARFTFLLNGPRALGTVTERFRAVKVPVAPEKPVPFGPTVTATVEVVPWELIRNAGGEGFSAPGWSIKGSEAAGRIAWRKVEGTKPRTAAGAAAQWKTALPISGEWDVYVRWPVGAGRAAKAVYEIETADGEKAMVTLDQRKGGGKWQRLGRFQIDDPKAVTVRLSEGEGASGVIVAESLRFIGPFPTETGR